MTWLLIVIIWKGSSGGVSIHTERFETEKSCIVARMGVAAVANDLFAPASIGTKADCIAIPEAAR